jgi:hypothetical protein
MTLTDKRWTVVAMLLVAGFSFSAGSPEADVAKAEAAMADARAKRDVPAMAKLTADDFAWARANGAITGKPQLLEDLKAGRLDNYASEGEQRIRVYGNAAVVTGIRVLSEQAGKARIMVMNVWVKHDGAWQRVASQTTRLMQ